MMLLNVEPPVRASTIAALPSDAPQGRRAIVNGTELACFPGSMFGTGATTLWLPSDAYPGTVLGAYKAGTAYNAAPNSTWSWSVVGTAGLLTEPTGTTSLIDTTPGGGQCALSISNVGFPVALQYMYMRVYCTGAGVATSININIGDGTRKLRVTLTHGGVAGTGDTTGDSTEEVATGAGAGYVELVVRHGVGALSTILDYQTMTPIQAQAYFSVLASVTTAIDFGVPNVTDVASFLLTGFPCLAVVGV